MVPVVVVMVPMTMVGAATDIDTDDDDDDATATIPLFEADNPTQKALKKSLISPKWAAFSLLTRNSPQLAVG